MTKIFSHFKSITLHYLILLVNIFLSIVCNLIFYLFFRKYKKQKIFILPTKIFGTTLHKLINYQEFIKKEKLKKKNILFILDKVKETNTEIYPLISNNFYTIENNLLFNFFRKCALLNKNNFFNTTHIKNHNASFEFNILIKKLKFSKTQIKKKEILMKKIGIKNKFVCISNRDNLFHNKKNFNNYRNSKFEKLDMTIKYLKKKNYQIVRMGYYKKFKHKNYLSIQELSKNEKDLADLILPSVAEFSICGVSGLNYVSRLFNKYSIIHNFVPYNLAGGLGKSIILPKLIARKKKKLNYSQLNKINSFQIQANFENTINWKFIKKINVTEFQSDFLYKKNNLNLIENSASDILNSVKELIALINNKYLDKNYLKKNDKIMKKCFKNIVNKNTYISKKWLDKNFFFHKF